MVHRLLTAVASLVAKHGLSSWGARGSCSMEHGIFLDQGSNPCLPHWQADSLPLSRQGSPEVDPFELNSLGAGGSYLA